MNFSKLVNSFFLTLIATFFIMLGIISLMTPWLPSIRAHIILFLLENTLALTLFGSISVIIGGAILASIVLTAKHRYYLVKSGQHGISVDEAAIQQFLDKYWAELFPKCEVPNKVTLKNNRIHLVANLPDLPLAQQKSLLERIERDLTEGFESMLGYQKEFYLSVSFRDSK